MYFTNIYSDGVVKSSCNTKMNVVPDLMIAMLVLMIALVPTIFSEGCLELQEYQVKSDNSLTLKLSSKVECPDKIRIYDMCPLCPSWIREVMKLAMKAVLLIMAFVSASASVETVFEENSLKMIAINFKEEAIFPVTSTLLYSKTSAILFDAQFSLKEADKLVNIIKETQTTPSSIIITCGDPDYYFGLEALVKAYPSAEIVASSKVVNHISQTKDAKLKTWAPQLGNTAPNKLYVPKPIDKLTFSFDNTKQIQMMEVDSYAAYVWIPENKIILGGVGICWNIHVWVADTQTLELRLNWRQVLQKMIDLQPKSVIPGHFIGDRPLVGDEAIRFTLKYLETLEEVLQQNNYKNSAAVISSMKTKYPNLGEESNLELSAKVLTGETTFSK